MLSSIRGFAVPSVGNFFLEGKIAIDTTGSGTSAWNFDRQDIYFFRRRSSLNSRP